MIGTSSARRSARVGLGQAVFAVAAAAVVAVTACTEETPSGPDDSQLPTSPVTVSLQLPWEDFGSNMQVFGGYGRVDDMNTTVVARAYDGVEARTLLRFDPIPRSASVRDDSTQAITTDTALVYVDAYIVLQVDTAASTKGPMQLAFGQTAERWESQTATWTNAVDRVDSVAPWSVPGGGAVIPVTTRDYDVSTTDSLQFFFGSEAIQRWKEGSDSVRAGRIDLLTDGHRVKFVGATLRVIANSNLQADTTIIFNVDITEQTFIYDPPAAPPVDGMRVGGAPAWRTVLDVSLPTTLDGPPELCATVGCPFALGPQHVTYAALQLRTRLSPQAFQPTDTVAMEVRAVLDRSTLPKAPLGGALGASSGTPVPPALTGVEGSVVDLPVTRYVQNFLAGPDSEGHPPPGTLAILAAPEPNEFSFASFFGPGGPNAPVLNLVLTVSQPMEIR